MASVLDFVKDNVVAGVTSSQDPELAEALRLVKEIIAAEAEGPSSNESISIKKANQYLRLVRFYQQHKWIVPVGAGAIVFSILMLGRASKRQ